MPPSEWLSASETLFSSKLVPFLVPRVDPSLDAVSTLLDKDKGPSPSLESSLVLFLNCPRFGRNLRMTVRFGCSRRLTPWPVSPSLCKAIDAFSPPFDFVSVSSSAAEDPSVTLLKLSCSGLVCAPSALSSDLLSSRPALKPFFKASPNLKPVLVVFLSRFSGGILRLVCDGCVPGFVGLLKTVTPPSWDSVADLSCSSDWSLGFAAWKFATNN